jgi:hypothetical protein
MEWVERLHFVELVGAQVALTQRRHSEINEGLVQQRAAEAAGPGRNRLSGTLIQERGPVVFGCDFGGGESMSHLNCGLTHELDHGPTWVLRRKAFEVK